MTSETPSAKASGPDKKATPLARATHPERTVWVSANAGSGKTYVLSRRVIRLLLEGAKPSELLCLTFTKVAASEMANKVFKILGEWALLDDNALGEAISEITDRPASGRQVARARHLFATALDTPGGLRIQTIHAFCEALLHQFPLEANIPGHFDLMDETDQALYLDEARRRVILASLGLGTSSENVQTANKLSEAFHIAQAHAGDKVIEETILQLVHQRDWFFQWLEAGGGDVSTAYVEVWEDLGLAPELDEPALVQSFGTTLSYDESELELLRTALEASKAKTAPELLIALEAMRTETDERKMLDLRRGFFLKSKDEPKSHLISTKFTDDNQLRQAFQREQALLAEQLEKIKTLKVLKASEAILLIAEAILIEYGNLKQRNGLQDFADLISKTANLLGREAIAGWIQYKLDAGIRHVLVDEAQDTSPVQWQIIKSITDEFYAGHGIERGIRTLFVVGDEKQSIYSFQGADPEEFDRQYRRIMKAASRTDPKGDSVPLSISFRSTEEVLSAVDQVFSIEENRKGLSSSDLLQTHSVNRQRDRGEVFIWPLERKPKKEKREDWLAPLDQLEESDAEIRLAKKIAATIRNWIDKEERLPGREKPIRPGDILILVRKRDRFVPAMSRALKDAELVSAGADRLKLTEHIAVEDMIALGRFATSPMDDLSLASLLKSPLFGFSEENLFDLAYDRGNRTLLEAIEDTQMETANTVHVILKDILASAHRLPVYEFYARIFARYGLRKKYLHRLGSEVEEVLDGFLQAALDYDNRNGLGVMGFVEWLASAAPELKREVDMESNEIRIITVHSSKGLEAPIVFLVDPGSKAFRANYAPKVVNLENDDGTRFPVWQTRTEFHLERTKPVFESIAEQAEEEYRRLLYVGMTRAADRLIVCGYGAEEIKHPHWHSMILAGLNASRLNEKLNGRLVEIEDENGNHAGHQWLIDNPNYREKATVPLPAAAPVQFDSDPKWFEPAPLERPMPRPLSPSGILSMLEIEATEPFEGNSSSKTALTRGNVTHQLLQALPEIPRSDQQAFASAWLRAKADDLGESTRADILEEVGKALDKAKAAGLLAPGSGAEVEIAGTIKIGGKPRNVHGTIDRLVITENDILVADYKTNRRVPESADDVSSQYIAQMALYRELLRNIHPGKKVKTIILWTQNARMMEIPDDFLDGQLALLNKS